MFSLGAHLLLCHVVSNCDKAKKKAAACFPTYRPFGRSVPSQTINSSWSYLINVPLQSPPCEQHTMHPRCHLLLPEHHLPPLLAPFHSSVSYRNLMQGKQHLIYCLVSG
jgi:hypothetical protein